MNSTIAYYDDNAERFYEETVHADMSALYGPFLELLPPNGKILDAGCGSGRDSLQFVRRGYRVEAFDASLEMCRRASALIRQPVHHKPFDEIEWNSEFDGVWACASLVHVGRNLIDATLETLCRVLKPKGLLFTSFKLRDGEWSQDGRSFNGYCHESFRDLIERHHALSEVAIWTTDDVRPARRNDKWLNGLLRKSSG